MKAQKCDVHDYLPAPANVPIHYGSLYVNDEFIEAREKLFPKADASVMGGCLLEDES